MTPRLALLGLTATLLIACAAPSEDGGVTDDGNELQATKIGEAAFSFDGADIRIATSTHGYSMKFQGSITHTGTQPALIECHVGANGRGETLLWCDERSNAFTIRVGPDGRATIAFGETLRLWLESDPSAVPIPALGLRGMAPQPIAVGAHDGVEPLAISARVDEALVAAGAIQTSAGKASVSSWSVLDPQLSLRLEVDPGNGAAAKRYDCYSSTQSPNLWAARLTPSAGLASASVLASRIKSAAEWQVTSCKAF